MVKNKNTKLLNVALIIYIVVVYPSGHEHIL